MQPAVKLVETYLRWNGYFTVTEYPVQQFGDPAAGAILQATDVDVLAVRLPNERQVIAKGRTRAKEAMLPLDPELQISTEAMDVLVAEVKEGPARFNSSLLEPEVLHAVIDRIGCCPHAEVPSVVKALGRRGEAEYTAPGGTPVRVRMACFAGQKVKVPGCVTVIPLGHVLESTMSLIRENEDRLRGSQFGDDAFALLHLVSKLGAQLQVD